MTMNKYWNPERNGIVELMKSERFVDKTGLIEYTNRVLRTEQKYVYQSRPAGFGKTTAAEMLCAYYEKRQTTATDMFQDTEIASHPSFSEHLNQHNVIYLDMDSICQKKDESETIMDYVRDGVLAEIEADYAEYMPAGERALSYILDYIYAYDKSCEGFVFIIDNWDTPLNYMDVLEERLAYVDFICSLLKDKSYVELAYMTGELPIKKYGTQGGLNMFDEFTMSRPTLLAQYFGFTAKEVQTLCAQQHLDFEQIKQQCGGYKLKKELQVYHPDLVFQAVFGKEDILADSTELLQNLLRQKVNGLDEAVEQLIHGGQCQVHTGTFVNDKTTFYFVDDVLTLLVHLGYLTYDQESQTVYIPNETMREMFMQVK